MILPTIRTRRTRMMATTRHAVAGFAGLFLLPLLVAANATAAPISFNTALPVAKGEFVWREQLVLSRSGKDPSGLERKLSADSLVSVVGYGATPKLALFAVLPYSNKSLARGPSGREIKHSNKGIADPTLFGRYTLYQEDGAGKTLRLAGLAGVKLPVGPSAEQDASGMLPVPLQQSNGAWDGFVGLVTTYQTLDFQMDGQVLYRMNGSSKAIDFGDEIRLDGSLQYRLWPRELSAGVPGFINGVLEANWVQKDHNVGPAGQDKNSGGRTLTISPGLQYVSKRYIIETAVQIPVAQNLNGTGLESEYTVRTGFRINF